MLSLTRRVLTKGRSLPHRAFTRRHVDSRRRFHSKPDPENIDPIKFDRVARKLRGFFQRKGFVEVHAQNRLSILAACEDPSTIASFHYEGQVYPLPQTSQMWLEYELLKNPKLPGLFCLNTSFRNEPNPTPGRHSKRFPLFEFEMHGGVEEMMDLESELCLDLGFPNTATTSQTHPDTNDYTDEGYPRQRYEYLAVHYGVKELEHEHEAKLCENSPVFFITDFPEFTSPFWNMARNIDGTSKKVDVIIDGRETIGSAERSCDKEEMRHRFHTISDGDYAKTLYAGFTKDRVEAELDQFLKFDFFQRSGGGIGVTRMIKGLENNGLL